MDNNNNPIQPISNMQSNPVVNQTPLNPQSAPPQTPPSTPVSEGGSKMVLWLTLGLVLIILIVGGIYIFLNKNAKESAKTPAASTQPVTKELDNVSEAEVEAVGIGDLESEFSSVDQELKGL